MAALIDEFVGITKALNERGIEYAVCGGWAVSIYGFLRATLDIDLLILAENVDEVMDVAVKQGFDIKGLPLNFDGGKTKIRRVSKIDRESKELITLDLLLVTEVMESVWKNRRKAVWNAGEYQIVSVKGLILMKEMAGRPKDLIDLDYLRSIDLEEGMDDEN